MSLTTASEYAPKVFAIVLLGAILTACGTVNYDDQADQQLTTMTQAVNQQLITWSSQASSKSPVVYDTKFYDTLEADIKTLEIRMEASQDLATQRLIPIFDSLSQQVEGMRQLHIKQKTFADAPFLQAEADLLNAQLAALITFELSLKPNTATGSANSKTTSTATSTTGTKVPAAIAVVKAASGA